MNKEDALFCRGQDTNEIKEFKPKASALKRKAT